VPPPPPPLLFEPPPHAVPKTKPANSAHANHPTGSFPFLFLSDPRPAHVTTPISGNQSAYHGPEPEGEGRVRAVGPGVLTVRVAGVPGVMEPGLIEHFGANAGEGATEQERDTVPLNAANGLISTVEVDDPPGLTGFGENPEVDREKSGVISNTVPTLEAPTPP